MKARKFSTSVLRMDAFLTLSNSNRLTPHDGREFLVDVYPSLAAALAVGFGEDDAKTRDSFGCLRGDLATLYDAAVSAWSTKRTVRLEHDDDHEGIDFADGTIELARVLACQHLGRPLQGGAHEFGFDLLADLLVSRLDSAAKAEREMKARKAAA